MQKMKRGEREKKEAGRGGGKLSKKKDGGIELRVMLTTEKREDREGE